MTEPLAINEQSSHPAAPTRTKRFVCINPNCTMQFDRAEHLARHERKHTGEHTKTHIDNKKNKTRGRKRKQRRPAHVSPSTSEIDPTTPPVVDDFRARRVLSIQELCHPSNEEIMVSAARYISRSDLQAIGILVFMSREA
ncbi:hypothetical protein RO3G_00231 [Rhizopus delemar RA 99-880]|uniref:C2H2-type domain-containing protein n=1 Tax=Rhizopus delemar (strain RA 99-880 / ATCC MYA-4621 / FGSC 9543 / NRRL 43880) TaxID=246409 RepID=I1BH47_RHIO9|nr:hypothetical protein RO3G_00231 [Rhizopus delemar RA 99-880]|eukprot:EIE75527.1 hypothetical protein RO3G_00231 [Rhizopus delemar RA 99-880]